MKSVMAFGTFDIFHIGHLKTLKQAKQLGDKLIVVIARDVNVRELKEKGPVHNEDERREIISNIEVVDKAVLGNKSDVYKVIKDYKPDTIALGYDQSHFVDKLRDKLQEFGLDCNIERLKPYKKEKIKSSKIKKKL
ncbi:MAG: adenylyltransferase/cytidyltransferase family protein [Candidatus Magasanikbacteria bacterium]